MQRSFQDLFPNVQLSPARLAVFGGFIGAMAALAGLRLLGEPLAAAIAPMPAYAAVLIATAAGAAIGWTKHRNG